MSLKGFCANSEGEVNQFSPDFIIISWGDWLINPLINFGESEVLVIFDDSDKDTEENDVFPKSVANIQAVALRHNPLWILLREPDLSYPNVQDGINKANADKALILSAVPSAKFILSTGTGVNPPYKENSYGRQLLAGMTSPKKIKYLGFTFYPDPAYPSFGKFINKMHDWAVEEEKGLAALEYGIPINLNPAPISEGVPYTYTSATDYMQDVVDYFAWYAQRAYANTDAAGYRCILDANGLLTLTGQEWNNY